MKGYVFALVALLVVLTSCRKDEGPKYLDPNTKLNINIRDGLRSEGQTPWTPLEVVQKATKLQLIQPGEDVAKWTEINDSQRDYTRLTITFPSDYIIRSESAKHPERKVLDDFFITSRDVLLTYNRPNFGGLDTVAYIPNATIKKAYKEIHDAWDRRDIESVYRLFQEAFTAIPITGEGYKALKAEGKN